MHGYDESHFTRCVLLLARLAGDFQNCRGFASRCQRMGNAGRRLSCVTGDDRIHDAAVGTCRLAPRHAGAKLEVDGLAFRLRLPAIAGQPLMAPFGGNRRRLDKAANRRFAEAREGVEARVRDR